jgi:cobalt/nickel transport system permease protein
MVGGWIALASIIIKGILTISVALLLVATIGIDKIAGSMRSVRIPKVFVLQLLLTYRYISVLIEEVERLIRAYLIRAPKQKGVQPNVWGSLAGQLLIRSFDRAGRVYQAMLLRGFTGEYDTGGNTRIKMFDIVFMGLWVLFFLIVRIFNLPEIIGIIITGGIL